MKTRSPLFWTTFAAGCIAGCIGSVLFQPQFAAAVPSVTNGQPFEELNRRLLALEQKTSAQSVDEAGNVDFNAPVVFRKKIIVDPIVLFPDRTGPDMLIKGSVAIEAPLHRPLLELTALEGAITPIDAAPPALSVDTRAILFPVFSQAIQTLGGDVEIADASGKARVTPYSVELLVHGNREDAPQVVSEWYVDVDSRSYFSVDTGTFGEAAAYEFKELGGGGGGDEIFYGEP